MTKARDLSNLISTGVPNSLITLDANEIPNIDASKITSGSIADARIPASAVSQHATSFDDNKIVNDISTLAIRQASNENKGAYNTNSMFVDVFQDDTGIASNTNAPRNSSEYVSTNTPAGFTVYNSSLSTNLKQLYNFDNSLTDMLGNQNLINSGVTFEGGTKKLGTHSAYFNGGNTTEFSFDNGSGSAGVPYFHTNNSNGSFPPSALSIAYWAYWTPDNTNWNMVFDGYNVSTNAKRNYIFTIGNDISSANAHDKPAIWDGSDQNWGNSADGGSDTTASAISHNTWLHIVQTLTSSKKQIFVNGALSASVTGSFGYGSDGTGTHVRIGGRDSNSDYQYRGYLDQFGIWDKELSVTDAGYLYNSGSGNVYIPASISATGNFISNAITAPSSVSSMGAIVTYQDTAGTNALNTDIVLQLSADNGSNFTTATLTAMPDFASGIKMAKVNDLSVTAGTQLKYKISFANQASGSKEARIRGVSLQY
jgi:hypothetical protein